MIIDSVLGWLHGKDDRDAIPETLWRQTLARLPFLDRLLPEEKSRLRQLTEDFLAEKEFAGAGGLELTDAICVSIAVQACLPILNLGLENYRDWIGIVVYADEFIIPRAVEDEFGVVHEYREIAAGEAWSDDPVLISWQDAAMAGDGYNVVIHEFAHKLDMRNGEADGVPPLPSGLSRKTWERTLNAAYEDFCARVDAAEARNMETALDPYASESPGEFFAVMSEAFFETPQLLRDEYPDFYGQLTLFYRQDPTLR